MRAKRPPTSPTPALVPAEALHRVHAAAAMTQVPEPTIRAWERRYGVPRPQRTASGYRLYGAREIDEVREMRRLCESGMAAAEAARLILSRSKESGTPVDSSTEEPPRDPFASLSRELVEAVEAYDDARLDDVLARATYLGGTAIQLIDRVLTPALRMLGDKWHRGEVTIDQEHFASDRLATAIRGLLRLTSGGDGGKTALFACFAEEQHEIGMLGTAARFASWGWHPIVLGRRTPPEAIRPAVSGFRPALVALSVTIAPDEDEGNHLVDRYAEACEGVPWIVGGGGAHALAARIRARGGHLAPEDPALLRQLSSSLTLAKKARQRSKRRPPS